MPTLYRTDGATIDSSNKLSLKELVMKNKDKLTEVDLRKTNLRGVDLSFVNLSFADLQGADLRFANLREANLRKADLLGANLRKANLSYANLRGADFREANLKSTNLKSVNLFGADCSFANAQKTNLRDIDLRGVDLCLLKIAEADLRNAKYDYKTLMLQVDWEKLSDELTLELMRQDAQLIGEELITDWSNGGECPYVVLDKYRDFKFKEKMKLWKPGKPKYGKDQMRDLFKALCEEKGVKI